MIRERKGMSVNQLAAKSGVPAISISEYESGHPIRGADLPKLAKALYVEEWDIDITSQPRPRRQPAEPDSKEPDKQPTKRPKPAKVSHPPAPARPSQIEHLLTLSVRQFGKDRDDLEQELGKPLENLTRKEASTLLRQYQKLLSEARAPESPIEEKAKRRRAYLPEGVDEFELKFLTSQQEAKALVHFTLFNGEEFTGHIIGFGPYSITIRESRSGDEVTLQKLAIAYYRVGERS
jgi:transcriptional regulator with XRE-family HTH domain